jgi:glyoxylase-like metal-dependent hydrolase (beta-lactamase superfamily II)
MLDAGLYGVSGTSAVYLVRGGRTCLIDSGDATESSRIVRGLGAMDAFPPDMVVLTHAHYEHCQGVPRIRNAARSHVEVLSGRDSLPLLEDQSWNRVFKQAKGLRNVTDVKPLDDGDVIDLGGIELLVVDVPGHIPGHIALLDTSTGYLFVGDALGYHFAERAVIPPFIPPYWDMDAFEATVRRLRSLEVEAICFAHYGCVGGEEAHRFLESAVRTCHDWWALFQRVDAEGRLDETDRLVGIIMEEMGLEVPDLRVEKMSMRMLLGLLNASRRVTGRPALEPSRVLFGELVKLLVKGYRISHQD